MDTIKDWERDGIKDFLRSQPDTELAISLAKVISKKNLIPGSLEDAIDIILLHSTSVLSILNRKSVTKNILFRYLHDRKVSVTTESNKQLLIELALTFWKKVFDEGNYEIADAQEQIHSENDRVSYEEPANSTETRLIVSAIEQQTTSHDIEHFPINQMARKFAAWFFENINSGGLKEADLWHNCKCTAHFINQQSSIDQDCTGAELVLQFCQSLRSNYGLYFNPNVTHLGTQGRMDCHGLVLVLSCGTLHKVDQLVGTFEWVFGLSRDPYLDNNWKVNQMKIRLYSNVSQSAQNALPTLQACDALAPLMKLNVPERLN